MGILIGMAFLTLLERNLLGYVHIRKGPYKVGYLGLFQPFADAIKLFCKEQIWPYNSNYIFYYFCPVYILFLILILWILIPFREGLIYYEFGLIFFMCCLRLSVFPLIFSGWASNSKYSILGCIRAIAQTISYEVRLVLVILCLINLITSYNLKYFIWFQEHSYIIVLVFCVPLVLVWFLSRLAEINRSPFDLAEGESELVSGFNVEYSRGGFAIIFMAEYTSIIFISIIFVIFFWSSFVKLIFYVKMVFIMALIILVRGTVPRVRYDQLIYLVWKCILPLTLNYLFFYLGFVIFF